MRREGTLPYVWWLALGSLALAGCRSKSEAKPGTPDIAGAAGPTVSGPDVAGSASPAVEGRWRDLLGDAPWRWIELTATDRQHGRFAGHVDCMTPPCTPPDEGDYTLDGAEVTLRTERLGTDAFSVHIGGDVMEWRKDSVMQRRFARVPPPAPPLPDLEPWPPPGARPPPGTPCEGMTVAGCVLSPDCVLEQGPREQGAGRYVCRPATGPCEGGMAQSGESFEADCGVRAGCRFHPSECFCPGTAGTAVPPAPGSDEAGMIAVSCTCGGGPFRRCLAEP
ncbi:MAG: hypothetical protein HY907_12210 [Deltaproteobacteria bacterium]|nr:hypothetical protein [Deltaproteobacteria bacterium]